jgi:hypothetical protein
MGMTSEQLAELEDLATSLMTTANLETIFGVPTGQFAQAILEGSPEGLAIMRGRLLTEAKLRKSIINLALAGSGPAQAMAKGFLDEMRVGEA